MIPQQTFVPLATVLGLALGSFYNVCVHNYIKEIPMLSMRRSACPKCGHKLSWWENIPLLSYILLMGRCRSCEKRISSRYPLLELTSGLWAMALAIQYGASWQFAVLMVIGGILLVASFIDFATYLLPDVLTLPGALIALLAQTFLLGPNGPLENSLQAVYGALLGAGMFLLLQQGYRLLRQAEGLGSGDVKLMLMIGAITGIQGLPLAILAGAFSALGASVIYMSASGKGTQTRIPFGPFLSLGAMIQILWGKAIWTWYVGLFM